MFSKSIQFFAESILRRQLFPQQHLIAPQLGSVVSLSCPPTFLEEAALWFAVPKKKVTRHKKRLKTTVQKRIPLRENIIVDPRTGQVTLKHRLPLNWKDYLPTTEP